MGKIDLKEGVEIAAEMIPLLEASKAAIDKVGDIPKEQRKPSDYITATITVLEASKVAADKFDEALKD